MARWCTGCTTPYPEERREAIHAAILDGSAEALCSLHAELGEWLGEAALRVCDSAGVSLDDVDAIGSHGQTVWHTPAGAGDARVARSSSATRRPSPSGPGGR